MNKINKLIQQLCPNGVEYKKIIDIAEVGTGNSNRQDAEENGKYPFYVRSKAILRINKYEYDEEAIIIPGEGGIGEIFHYVNGKYALHQRAYRIHIITEKLLTKFVYFYMMNYFKFFIKKKAVNATVTSIRKPMIEQFPIPIPPIEIQEEIIKILDKFNELENIIQEEKKMREKQYEYCISKLMNNNYEIRKISEITKCQKEKNKNRNIENAYSITQKGLISTKEFFGEKTNITSKDTSGYYIVKHNWFVYSPSRIDVGSINYLKDKGPVIVSPLDVIFSVNEEVILPKFLWLYLVSKKGMNQIVNLIQGIEGTGRKNLPYERFSNIKVPVPSIKEQKKIIKVLDEFEQFINNSTTGLSAELEFRKKQYHYYSNKILNFKEVSVNE